MARSTAPTAMKKNQPPPILKRKASNRIEIQHQPHPILKRNSSNSISKCNDHGSSKDHTTIGKKKNKKVQFVMTKNDVVIIPSIREFTKDECQKTWYRKSELGASENRAKSVLRCAIRKGVRRCQMSVLWNEGKFMMKDLEAKECFIHSPDQQESLLRELSFSIQSKASPCPCDEDDDRTQHSSKTENQPRQQQIPKNDDSNENDTGKNNRWDCCEGKESIRGFEAFALPEIGRCMIQDKNRVRSAVLWEQWRQRIMFGQVCPEKVARVSMNCSRICGYWARSVAHEDMEAAFSIYGI